jgi:hypothetical protein
MLGSGGLKRPRPRLGCNAIGEEKKHAAIIRNHEHENACDNGQNLAQMQGLQEAYIWRWLILRHFK